MSFSEGFSRGGALALSKRQREDLIAAATEEAAAKRKADFEKTMESIRTESENTFKGLTEAAVQLAPTLGDDPEGKLKELERTAKASLMVYASQLAENRARAIAAGAPEEVVALMPDPRQFVESRLPVFQAQVEAARQAAQDNQFETLSPEEVTAAGFPQGSVVQRGANGKMELTFDPTDDPSSLQQRVALLKSSGVDDATAEGIASGRYTVSLDPVTREAKVIDLSTGEQVGGPIQGPESGSAPPIVPPGTETAAALGVGGAAANISNIISDAFGAGLAYPKSQEASEAIQQIQTTTKLALQVAIPGRPAKDIRDDLEKLTVTPNSVFQGEERSKARFSQMKRFIDNNIAEKEAALAEPLSPADRALLKANVRELRTMQTSYQDLLEGFSQKDDGEKAPEGVPPEVAEVWQYMTPEERERRIKALGLPESKKKELTPIGTRAEKPNSAIINADGSRSTEQTISITMDDKVYVIPTIVLDDQGFLVKRSDDEAVELFKAGKNPAVGTFKTIKEADDFARKRSNAGGRYGDGRK